MKYKRYIVFVSMFLVVVLNFPVSSDESGLEREIESAKLFINKYYEDIKRSNSEVINDYYLEDIKKDEIDYISYVRGTYKVDKIEYIEARIVDRHPLTASLLLKEWYKPEDSPPPYLKKLYLIKRVDGKWKIMDVEEPGLP